MIDAPLALAFTAGLVATLNPCGFAMLPAYLSWYVGGDVTSPSRPVPLPERLGRALLVGGTVSFSFLVVFGITGSLVTAGVRSFVDYVPWVALIIGAAVAGLGIALLSGRHVSLALPTPQAGQGDTRPRSMLVFGASYAVASLSCTLPVFLSVVGSTFTRRDPASGIAAFVAYAAGMSLVLMTVTIAAAAAQHSLLRRLRALSRHIDRLAGMLLVVAGSYIVYYWVFNLATDPGETTAAGPARFVEDLSAEATAWVEGLGWRSGLLIFGAVTTAAAGTAVLARRAKPQRSTDDATDTCRVVVEYPLGQRELRQSARSAPAAQLRAERSTGFCRCDSSTGCAPRRFGSAGESAGPAPEPGGG